MLIGNFWIDLSKMEPYKLWKGGFVYGFFFEKSLYDATPLNQFIEQKFSDRKVKQHLNIAVTNVMNGDFKTFTEHHSNADLIKILQASVSFLGVSNPIQFRDSLYTSGSAIYENDVMAAINHCELLGYEEEDIIIDSILGGATKLSSFNANKKNSIQIM